MNDYDVIVVGAGAAGCVAASRLTEDAGRRVLLLEAGPDYGSDPDSWPTDLRDPSDVPAESHPWDYAEAGRPADRPKPLPRARVVGGSTTINACTWLRGSAVDYDEWALAGNVGWGFSDLLPYFRKAETDPLGGALHGTAGPVPVFRAADSQLSPIDRTFLAAAQAVGIPYVADLNGRPDLMPGIGPRPQNVANGVRMNAAFTYLSPARPRANLVILPDVLVDRVLLERGRAVGVRTASGDVQRADEVVLAAGAYGSPAILLRSGIGPAEHLRNVGVPVAVDLPGVGGHLLDHPLVLDGLGRFLVATDSEPNDRSPQFLPLMLLARRMGAQTDIDVGVLLGQAFDPETSAWIAFPLVCLLDARSEGRLQLTAAEPEATLDIRHFHLEEVADVEALMDGVDLAIDLFNSRAMLGAVEPVAGSRESPEDRPGLAAWLRQSAGTMFHPAGTCRMAPATDPAGVVDEDGRVRGVDALRVVDASIFPSLPRATIHSAVVAVAEKLAADMARPTRAGGA